MTVPNEPQPDVTFLLEKATGGDASALDSLLPVIYDELRATARGVMRGQHQNNTLQPTALVHDAWLKLCGYADREWNGRGHFFATAAKAMRQVLADHARANRREKRGGGAHRVTLDESSKITDEPTVDIIALDEALDEIGKADPTAARIVELRFFAGLSVDEVAEMLEVSKSTVKNHWRAAKAWLQVKLEDETPS